MTDITEDVALPARKPRARKAPITREPTTADPLEIAMEAVSEGREVHGPALSVLVKHGRLLDHQIASERASLGLKLLTAVAGIAAAAMVGALVWGAAHDRGLVVEAFQTPPDYAADGLNGVVLASKVLDRIAAMDAQSQSVRASDSYENSWGQDLKVEIAQSGVSVGDVQRFLRHWLGHETRISGELVRTGGKLALTVRTGGQKGGAAGGSATVEGAPGDLDALVTKAAEAIYGRTQPFQYSKYLEYQGRPEEAMAAARGLAETGPRSEKAWAWAQICNLEAARGDLPASIAACRRGLRHDPRNPLLLLNLASGETLLGHDEASLTHLEAMLRELGPHRRQLSAAAREVLPHNDAGMYAAKGDYAKAVMTARAAMDDPDFQDSGAIVPLTLAVSLAQAHDPDGAAAINLGPRAASIRVADMLNHFSGVYVPAAAIAEARGAWGEAAAALEAVAGGLDLNQPTDRLGAERFLWPQMAVDWALAGDLEGARGLAARLPLDCEQCVLARARVAAASGDAGSAERWFAKAVQDAPSLPQPLMWWGQARLDRGDAAGALNLARRAERAGPRYADAFKLEGDALMRRGDRSAAARAYRQAVERAPRWVEARRALGAVGG